MAYTTEQKTANIGYVKVFVVEYDTEKGIPSYEEIEKDEHFLSDTGEPTKLTYGAEYTEIVGNLGVVRQSYLKAENVTVTLGAISNLTKNLTIACPTARVTTENGVTTVLIGGLENATNKSYIVHLKNVSQPHRYTMIASATSSFTLTFADTPSPVDVTFTAQAGIDGSSALLKVVLGEPTTTA